MGTWKYTFRQIKQSHLFFSFCVLCDFEWLLTIGPNIKQGPTVLLNSTSTYWISLVVSTRDFNSWPNVHVCMDIRPIYALPLKCWANTLHLVQIHPTMIPFVSSLKFVHVAFNAGWHLGGRHLSGRITITCYLDALCLMMMDASCIIFVLE